MLLLKCLPTGPLLRLERAGERLTKAQRYGQPFERPVYSSAIPPRKMQAIVQSYLGFGLQGLKPDPGGYSWQDLQGINQQIHWQVSQMSSLCACVPLGAVDRACAAVVGRGCEILEECRKMPLEAAGVCT